MEIIVFIFSDWLTIFYYIIINLIHLKNDATKKLCYLSQKNELNKHYSIKSKLI